MNRLYFALALLFVALSNPASAAGDDYPYAGVIEINTAHDFDTLWDRLAQAVKASDMLLVSRASASRGAKSRGIDIPGNGVVGVFRNDFAVRMLQASVPAGIEAPLRFYLTENDDGSARLSYRRPSAVFEPYGSPELDAMARELDIIFADIAAAASQ